MDFVEIKPNSIALLSLLVTIKKKGFILENGEFLNSPPKTVKIGETKYSFMYEELANKKQVFWHYQKT
jgi:hypothetical protein